MRTLLLIILLFGVANCVSAQQHDDNLATGIADPLQGLVVNVLGDSYVRNHRRPVEESWHYKVAAMHGMQYHNYGRNGGCVAFDRTHQGFGTSLLVRYADMDPDADLVLIIAGHNDAVMVGTSRDSLAMFADSLDLLLYKVRAQCPRARVAWVTPWWVNRAGFKPVARTIRKICRRHGVPVLNNYRRRSMVKVRDGEFRKRYFQSADDMAHLNADGHDLFVPVGDDFVKKVLQK